MTRYTQQSLVSEVGEKGQAAIQDASVLVVGAGGLGSPILLYLTAAGVGRIGIVDDDEVTLENLQGQVLYLEREIGAKKAVSAKANLERLNSSIKIDIFPERLTFQNVEKIFSPFDVIVDATDHTPTKYLINDAAVKFGKPVVSGSVNGFVGQVAIFDAKQGPCYRCAHPETSTSTQDTNSAGVVGPVMGMIGSIQAGETLKYIVQKHTPSTILPLIGKIMSVDARDLSNSVNRIYKNRKCSVCSQPSEKIVLNARDEVCWDDVMFVDVRELDEWNSGHIEGAVHIPLSKLRTDGFSSFPHFEKNKRIVAYCRSGIRSKEAAQLLKEKGLIDSELVVLPESMANILPYLKGATGNA